MQKKRAVEWEDEEDGGADIGLLQGHDGIFHTCCCQGVPAHLVDIWLASCSISGCVQCHLRIGVLRTPSLTKVTTVGTHFTRSPISVARCRSCHSQIHIIQPCYTSKVTGASQDHHWTAVTPLSVVLGKSCAASGLWQALALFSASRIGALR